ncbi:MAG: ABC transporter ATP-binding protein [Chloroflexi bacterium]|nr:MAG: ABC transporter ATP-binding protein [Chloroflexota bacterium]
MRYMVIRTEKLTKNFGRKPALQNLTLEVEPGEVFGVLGPKGAGKSTLLNILMNFIRPTSGVALVMGLDCQKQSLQIRRQVGYLPEIMSLPASLTGEQILDRFASLTGLIDEDFVADLANRFRVDLTRRAMDFTAVEKRALGIIQAFMQRPELVLLDAPAVGLDLERQTQLYRLIAETRASGATVLIGSQSLTEMERISDRVAVLYQGNLVAVERGVTLRARALRKIEMRFAEPIHSDAFASLPNVNDLVLEDNKLRCTLQGEPDALFKIASQFRLLDVISQQPSLDEVFTRYYGVGANN